MLQFFTPPCKFAKSLFILGLSIIQTTFYKIKYKNFHCESWLYNCRIKIRNTDCVNGGKIFIGKGCSLNNTTIDIFASNNTLIIEDNARFISSARIIMQDDDGQIKIGRNFEGMEFFILKTEKNTNITIGENCLFSARIVIRSGDGHSIIDPSSGKRINPGKDVTIEDKVWVGYGVNILKGAHIGQGSIIGSQAIVADNDIPPHSVTAGTPARVVKENIDWCYERI